MVWCSERRGQMLLLQLMLCRGERRCMCHVGDHILKFLCFFLSFFVIRSTFLITLATSYSMSDPSFVSSQTWTWYFSTFVIALTQHHQVWTYLKRHSFQDCCPFDICCGKDNIWLRNCFLEGGNLHLGFVNVGRSLIQLCLFADFFLLSNCNDLTRDV